MREIKVQQLNEEAFRKYGMYQSLTDNEQMKSRGDTLRKLLSGFTDSGLCTDDSADHILLSCVSAGTDGGGFYGVPYLYV